MYESVNAQSTKKLSTNNYSPNPFHRVQFSLVKIDVMIHNFLASKTKICDQMYNYDNTYLKISDDLVPNQMSM